MSVVDMLYTILIGPLQLVFEIIYSLANRLIDHPGLSIVVLSLLMNLLVLPLYKRADAMQEATRDIDQKLKNGVEHIKKTFSGDERMMILQTYYRQNNYKPTDALNGSVSLLLEIPFFMAAYNFLSHLEILHGASLGPIADLGAPDGLVQIGGFSINLLPILMTAINVISSSIYLKGFPAKMKVQLYAMAAFFLVFLYTSPSGLVFYWTLNNVFSLGKNLVYKLIASKKAYKVFDLKANGIFNTSKNDKMIILLGTIILTILLGVLIPSVLIASSPQEFIDVSYFYNPIYYVVNSLCLAVGTFFVWFRIFYWIANPFGKRVLEIVVWLLCVIALVNYFFFGTNLGIISSNLLYENGLVFAQKEVVSNYLILVIASIFAYLLIQKWSGFAKGGMITMIVALAWMSVLNFTNILPAVEEAEVMASNLSEEKPHFTLSEDGQNVVVIMLDRALGAYVPYLFNEKPELKKQYDGFTYYTNVLSYGIATNFGTPGLYGGYEYTPIEMNKRSDELLVTKHNESLKVMPVLFSENGYDVTVCDPSYANYQWIPDLSIYSEYPEIQTYIADGQFGDVSSKEQQIESRLRNFFCYSMMKVMPVSVQDIFYNNGNYNQIIQQDMMNYSGQIVQGTAVAESVSTSFMNAYNVLANLDYMTNVEDTSRNTFLMLTNNMTHEPMLLQEPEYKPSQYVDNTVFDAENMDRFMLDGVTLKMENPMQFSHYQTNMAALMLLGEWFDYLRENDVYDNTKIILVSDHGNYLEQCEKLKVMEGAPDVGVLSYYPLLMVKDFNSNEFTVSDEFMTNADVPTIATEKLIDNPINPFTKKQINNKEKNTHEQYVLVSSEVSINKNKGCTFLPGCWYAVKDDIWNDNNWRFIEEWTTMPSELQGQE